MDNDRRSFLKQAGGAAFGLGCGLPLLNTLAGCASGHGAHGSASTNQWAMVIDLEKCRLPGLMDTCTEACHKHHNVPNIPDPEDEIKWLWTEQYKDAFPDQTHDQLGKERKTAQVPVLCNHCDRPSCVRVCPTKATWKRESDGIVMMDMHRCIGCRYCIAACPYGARSFNWRDPRIKDEDGKYAYFENGELASDFPTRTKGVVEKCNFCAERLRNGQDPACVEAAQNFPGGEGALVFGNLAEPDSPASRVLREQHTICRRIGLGTRPNVYYIV